MAAGTQEAALCLSLSWAPGTETVPGIRTALRGLLRVLVGTNEETLEAQQGLPLTYTFFW